MLFRGSFEPGQVVFSNDGPLGAAVAQEGRGWYNLRGFWQDLNWIGIEQPGGILSSGYLLFATLGPVLVAKFIAPISLLLLGLCAWLAFRQWRFSPMVCLLVALAAALNSNAFSVSCWGLYAWSLSRASFFLALAALPTANTRHPWLRTILAGFAIGMCVMDGFDVGALFSLFFAAYVVFQSLISSGPGKSLGRRLATGVGRVAVVAFCAALLSAEGVAVLIGTQVKGVVGMQQDRESKERRWAEATYWSLPKIEALRVVIPGLFGYRMAELYGQPQASVEGANYWGAAGQVPGTTQYRHSGQGEFAGTIVALVAIWAGAQSLRRKQSVFTETERKNVWFWGGAAIVSLLLAFGRHAPLYQIAYAIPYLSTIRNPIKFLHPFHVSVAILFGYGLQGLYRRHLLNGTTPTRSVGEQLKAWWKSAPAFDRNWTTGCLVALGAGLLGWMIYGSSRTALVRHLQQAGFPDGQLANSIAGFSVNQVGLFVLFLALSVSLFTLIQAGIFSGRRARWAGLALGILLVVDLARANFPWIVYLDYKTKYETNPIIDQLRQNSTERRVTGELFPMSRAWLINDQGAYFAPLYFEWLQHHFQYYRVQSLDINQMPRVPDFDKTYLNAFRPPNSTNLLRCGRLWELSNTRYILGMTGFLDLLNKQIDPGHERFRVHTAFNVVPKSSVPPGTPATQLTAELLTAVPDPQGQFALFEFTATLPRAKLFTHWIVSTNDEATLAKLADPAFDPAQTVLVANEIPAPPSNPGTNQSPDKVEVAAYEPKRVRLSAETSAPSVLLLNDHYNPSWTVTVDGQPVPLLRCNYIMRGVYLTPGRHSIEFRFQPPSTAFFITLSAIVAGVLICGFLALSRAKPQPQPQPQPEAPTGKKS